MVAACLMRTHLSSSAVWRHVHTGPANTIPSCLICPKAIIKLLACTASCLSLVIDFYKYSSRVTCSQTPTFKITISPSFTLFSGATYYEWLSLDFIASYFMFSMPEYKSTNKKGMCILAFFEHTSASKTLEEEERGLAELIKANS